MTNISSIHIQPTHIGEFFHNSREKETKNSIGDKTQNYCNRKAIEAIEMYRKDLEEKSNLYYKKQKRKLPKNTKTLFSAIFNLKEDSTIADVENVAKYLEEKLKVKIFQIAIHEDEGHFENGKFIKNRHAHIMFSGLDVDAQSIKRNKLNIHFLRQMQTDIANILGMERGKKREIGQRKRLDTYEYKKAVKNIDNSIQELEQKLKLDKNKINKYTKIFDKWLDEHLNIFNTLKKDDVLNLFKKFLSKMKNTITKLEEENKELKEQLADIKIQRNDLKFEVERLKKETKKLEEENKTIKQKVKQLDSVKIMYQNKQLKEENRKLKITIKELKEQISELRKQMIELNKNLEDKEKLFTKKDYQYLSKLKKELKKDNMKEIYEEFMQFKKQTLQKTKKYNNDIDI